MPRRREKPTHAKFRRDMKKAGFEVIDYKGRFFYDGPAVICRPNQRQEVYRSTDVRLQSDNMGLDYVLYVQD